MLLKKAMILMITNRKIHLRVKQNQCIIPKKVRELNSSGGVNPLTYLPLFQNSEGLSIL